MLRVADELGRKTLRMTWHYDRWRELNYRPMIEAYRRTFADYFARLDADRGLVPVGAITDTCALR